MELPPIVSPTEWQMARDRLLAKEKEATHARDALAAKRRRLPRVRIDEDYLFGGADGKASLLDLFDGRRQLIIYHFMFAPGVEGWPTAGCSGCTMFVDNLGNFARLRERDTLIALRITRPIGKYPGLSGTQGLDHSLVLLGRQRLQRRLRLDYR